MKIAFVEGLVIVGNGEFFENGTVIVEGNRVMKVSKENIPIPIRKNPPARLHRLPCPSMFRWEP